MTDNQLAVIDDLAHGDEVWMHYKIRDRLKELGAIDESKELTAVGHSVADGISYGVRLMAVMIFRGLKRNRVIDWDRLYSCAMRTCRTNITDETETRVALDHLKGMVEAKK